MCTKQWRSCAVCFLAGATMTSQAQIWNNTSRELSFDLSWPAHYLTITPQHGVIDPQSVHDRLFTQICFTSIMAFFLNELLYIQRRSLQILVSPNPALASKSALLPWSGQIYVQCDGQQKVDSLVRQKISIVLRKYNAVWLQFIKVQIRPDLALDVSSAPANTSLSALPPQAATPVLPVSRLITTNPVSPQTPQSPSALVEINSKTVVFPATYSGEMSGRTKPPRGQIWTLFTLV